MRFRTPATVTVALLLVVSGLMGCKEATLGPESMGRLEGQVLAAETNAALTGASVTTSPPTSALVTDEEGRFAFDDIEAGNYTITATHPGYQSGTVTISVQGDQTTQSTLFLDEEEEDTTAAPSLDVDIINWTTRTNPDTAAVDSAFVRVEYRARNIGETGIAGYEVYFRIETDTHTFLQEEAGDSLAAGQSDVAEFEKYTLDEEAQSVEVDDTYISDGGEGKE